MTERLADAVSTPAALEVSTDIVNVCYDLKGQDIAVLKVSKISDVCDFFVVVSARSDRHVQGLCNKVIETLDSRGVQPLTVEGLDKGHWVVMDFGDVLVHVFYEPLREHYDIEGLWARAPRMRYEPQGADGHLALRAA